MEVLLVYTERPKMLLTSSNACDRASRRIKAEKPVRNLRGRKGEMDGKKRREEQIKNTGI